MVISQKSPEFPILVHTLDESATILKLNRKTVKKMIDSGDLKAKRLPNGQYRIRHEDLEAFLSPEGDE